ncbi:MAG: hypothetical protein U0871_08155 [Gemmataceae bacterium]
MLAKEEAEIRPDETTGELEARPPLETRLCVDVVRHLKAGPVSGEKQSRRLSPRRRS